MNLTAVEVVYALPDGFFSRRVSLPECSSVRAAIEASGVLSTYPEIKLDRVSVGIFARRVSLDRVVTHGERVEIYRPLQVDPNTARQRRAATRARRSAKPAAKPTG